VSAIPLADLANPERLRGLIWCRGRVRYKHALDHEWMTDWKWMSASFVGDLPRHSNDPTNPNSWYFHGWEDRGVIVDRIEMTHYHDLPNPIAPQARPDHQADGDR